MIINQLEVRKVDINNHIIMSIVISINQMMRKVKCHIVIVKIIRRIRIIHYEIIVDSNLIRYNSRDK